MVRQRVLVSVDQSEHSQAALTWALQHACGVDRELHIIAVVDDKDYYDATGGLGPDNPHGDSPSSEILKKAIIKAVAAGVPDNLVHAYELPADGDSSGPEGMAAAIVNYANSRGMLLLVLGSRGLGAFRRSLMSLVGLGSVSQLVVQSSHVPVVLIKPHQYGYDKDREVAFEEDRHVAIAIEDAEQSQRVLQWALEGFLKPTDHLHMISHAKPFYQLGKVPPQQINRPTHSSPPTGPPKPPPSVASRVSRTSSGGDKPLELAAQKGLDGTDTADKVLKAAVEVARTHGVSEERLHCHLLPPHATPDRVTGNALVKAVKDVGAHVLLMGSRGSGSNARGAASIVGLGSSANYCIHHSPCPVLVLKLGEPPALEDGSDPAPPTLGTIISSDMGDYLDYSVAAAAAALNPVVAGVPAAAVPMDASPAATSRQQSSRQVSEELQPAAPAASRLLSGPLISSSVAGAGASSAVPGTAMAANGWIVSSDMSEYLAHGPATPARAQSS